MADKCPHNALVDVADGTGARCFGNSSQELRVTLKADDDLQPVDLEIDGPSGKRPPEAHLGDFAALVLDRAHEQTRPTTGLDRRPPRRPS